MTNDERASHLWRSLSACRELNADVTIATVTHWLEYHGAGSPDVPLMQERVRDDAKFWASCAQQFELEAYLAASLMELNRSPLSIRAAKRLAALAFKAMDAETQEQFKEWVNA
jgi:hypothetical protein